jgi:hypothetical protein
VPADWIAADLLSPNLSEGIGSRFPQFPRHRLPSNGFVRLQSGHRLDIAGLGQASGYQQTTRHLVKELLREPVNVIGEQAGIRLVRRFRRLNANVDGVERVRPIHTSVKPKGGPKLGNDVFGHDRHIADRAGIDDGFGR